MRQPATCPMESPVRRLVLLVSLAAGFALALALPAAGSTTRTLGPSARAAQARLVASEALASLADKAGPSDSQWYADGVWHSKDKACWFCATCPATLAATLWRVNGRTDPRLFKMAVATFDRTIAAQRNSNGSFGEQSLPNTQFFGVELGTTYLLLGNRLGPKHRVAWRKSIAGAADYLIRHGDLTWETNGNINLGNTELEWLAWAITGNQRFHDAYELSWRYTIHPPQARWPGYGLQITQKATGSRGASGAGYLAENGGRGPGFDPEYTMLQLSVSSRAYLLSHDPRFRRLSNLLWNQLSPLVKRPEWTFDARGGTRRSHIDMMTSPGMAVLATTGGRPDLLPSLDSQTSTAMYTTYVENALQNWGSASLYRGYGNELGVALLALASPPEKGTGHAAGLVNALRKSDTRHVAAVITRSGVRISWRSVDPGRPYGDRTDVLVDGRVVKRLRGSRTLLRLAPGLHQIAIAATGLQPGLSTVVTIPVS
jgi:hypothetical protein